MKEADEIGIEYKSIARLKNFKSADRIRQFKIILQMQTIKFFSF